MTQPEFQPVFLHVLQKQEDEAGALKRWREILKILGWHNPVPLHMVLLEGDVPATILHMNILNGTTTAKIYLRS